MVKASEFKITPEDIERARTEKIPTFHVDWNDVTAAVKEGREIVVRRVHDDDANVH